MLAIPTMTTASPTITTLKTSFLRSQILTLSQPLRPSPTFTTTNASAPAEISLREKAIDEGLYKLNSQLKKHNKLVYGPQATRHVAEQIDRLYWSAGETGFRGSVGEGEEWREVGNDLRDEAMIDQLPEEYNSIAAERAPELATRFTELSSQLKELSEKRKATKARLEAYRSMKGMIDEYGEHAGIQENLVTKNGEVEKELERMRMLMLRVERGIQGSDRMGGQVGAGEMDWEEAPDYALQTIMKPHA